MIFLPLSPVSLMHKNPQRQRLFMAYIPLDAKIDQSIGASVFEEKESVLDFLLQGFHYKNKILTILHELQVSAALIQVSA